MGIETSFPGCRDGKFHVSYNEKEFAIPIERYGEVIIIDKCRFCEFTYIRKANDEEVADYRKNIP